MDLQNSQMRTTDTSHYLYSVALEAQLCEPSNVVQLPPPGNEPLAPRTRSVVAKTMDRRSYGRGRRSRSPRERVSPMTKRRAEQGSQTQRWADVAVNQ
ncbi:hypothetical protein LSAT2_027756 [Lamellibrachia satsuma]|nr:hypothetical protein LSAT2_027756 [Lamellibrachia satsuma]